MNINITSLNAEISQDLKDYAREKILKYTELLEEPVVCDIVFSDEFGPKGGEDKLVRLTMTLPGEKNALHVEAQTNDFFATVDLVQEKLEREIVKYKDCKKIGDRHPKKYQEL